MTTHREDEQATVGSSLLTAQEQAVCNRIATGKSCCWPLGNPTCTADGEQRDFMRMVTNKGRIEMQRPGHFIDSRSIACRHLPGHQVHLEEA
jgi:hypothetical protein